MQKLVHLSWAAKAEGEFDEERLSQILKEYNNIRVLATWSYRRFNLFISWFAYHNAATTEGILVLLANKKIVLVNSIN